jgi:transposase
MQRQQLAQALPEIARSITRTIKAIDRELKTIEGHIDELRSAHVTEALQSAKGLGPVFQATTLALLPELGKLNRKQIAKLVGIAPINHDSGQMRGKRAIRGGRQALRNALYMATLSAVRWDPVTRDHYRQLRARGKAAKVALVACMRKLLTIINARRRDELNSESRLSTA